MSIQATSAEGFQSLLRLSRSSIANPPWFAAPVDAAEDDVSLTVVFHVPETGHGPVRVQASEQSVTVVGGPRAVRLCALPTPILPDAVETTRVGDLLRVRAPKKRPAAESRDVSAPTPR